MAVNYNIKNKIFKNSFFYNDDIFSITHKMECWKVGVCVSRIYFYLGGRETIDRLLAKKI